MVELLTLGLFAVGFVFLIKGADILIEGASAIAKRFGISTFVIGLTIVAFGTSVPELAVNVFASLQGNTELVLGNILGSNIANILLVLGFAAVMMPILIKKKIVQVELPISLLAILMVFFLANDVFITGAETNSIDRVDGIILITIFALFGHYIYRKVGKGRARKEVEEFADVKVSRHETLKSVMFILLGLAGLTLGGQWIVNGAIDIATTLGVTEGLIGLTIIAIGTSVSEVAATAMAVRKKVADMAIGNIIGSNIFNIFWVLGISAVIMPIPFNFARNFDVGTVIFATMLMFVFLLFVGRKYELKKWHGVLLMLLYAAFIAFSVFRG